MAGTYAIGLDVGATKMLGGVVESETGDVLCSVKTPSPAGSVEGVYRAIEENIARVLAEAPDGMVANVQRIGLGLPGQVDRQAGVLRAAPNLGGGITSPLPLAEPLQARFGLPVIVGNDLEVAALGESKFGAGRGVKLFACVFVGTGVGGALMVDGVRFGGASGSAGEIGHVIVVEGGRPCGCGQRGHLEAYASRSAIVEILREEVRGGARSSLKEMLLDTEERVRSKPIAKAVEEGDALAIKVLTDAGRHLGTGLADLINLWNPQRIVLGGGLMDRIDLLFYVAVDQAKRLSLRVPSEAVEIVRAELGDHSGMVGAALLE